MRQREPSLKLPLTELGPAARQALHALEERARMLRHNRPPTYREALDIIRRLPLTPGTDANHAALQVAKRLATEALEGRE